MNTIETKRLQLRPWQEGDLLDLYEYASLPDVGPSAGWMPHTSLEESLKIIQMFQTSQDVYAIQLKSEKKVIGSIGLHLKKATDHPHYELGYVLSPYYEKHGYMHEACLAVLDEAFTNIGVKEVYVAHFVENLKSQKVILKLGFHYQKETLYESKDYGIKTSLYYVLSKEGFYKKIKEKNDEYMESK